jgi:hypothetical protein
VIESFFYNFFQEIEKILTFGQAVL